MEYDRQAAIAYAHKWAYARNPRFGVFDELGGDCTNFVSQCLFAGCPVMNEQPDIGWFYRSMSDRSPAWSSVFFMRRFLVENTGRGPHGQLAPVAQAQPGDVLQIAFVHDVFTHAGVVVSVGKPGKLSELLIAAHTIDSDMRPLSTYQYVDIRLIHIVGARE